MRCNTEYGCLKGKFNQIKQEIFSHWILLLDTTRDGEDFHASDADSGDRQKIR